MKLKEANAAGYPFLTLLFFETGCDELDAFEYDLRG
jgi:hypothetical protein